MKNLCCFFVMAFFAVGGNFSANGMPGNEEGNTNKAKAEPCVTCTEDDEELRPVFGKVTNTSGNPLYQATVKLLSDDGTTLLESTTTDSRGNYCFTNIAMGPYQLEVSKTGYVTSNQNICVTAAAQTEIDVELADD